MKPHTHAKLRPREHSEHAAADHFIFPLISVWQNGEGQKAGLCSVRCVEYLGTSRAYLLDRIREVSIAMTQVSSLAPWGAVDMEFLSATARTEI